MQVVVGDSAKVEVKVKVKVVLLELGPECGRPAWAEVCLQLSLPQRHAKHCIAAQFGLT